MKISIKLFLTSAIAALFVSMATPVRADSNHVWYASHDISENGLLIIEIGLNPPGWGHAAGLVYSVDGGSWDSVNATWARNQPGSNGDDEIWEACISGLAEGQRVEFALWGSFGDGQQIWDNNGGSNHAVDFNYPPVFLIPRDSFPPPFDLRTMIENRFQMPVRPWSEVVVSGVGVRDNQTDVASVSLRFTTDGWQNLSTVSGTVRDGFVEMYPGANYRPEAFYEFEMGSFAPGAHVEFYIEATDSEGHTSWLPGKWENFSFDVSVPVGRDFYVAGARRVTEAGTYVEIDLRMQQGWNHSVGVVYAVDWFSHYGPDPQDWASADAEWVQNDNGLELWRVRVPVPTNRAVWFAAWGDFSDGGDIAWDNCGGENYVTPWTWFFPDVVRDYGHWLKRLVPAP